MVFFYLKHPPLRILLSLPQLQLYRKTKKYLFLYEYETKLHVKNPN
ncbi:hypothetical protein HMPREF9419_0869 [Prevotella nigrescens ATCC 33563]|nr:hypothetical protein HMPREF9419_0869 [Prevotella nigrescens ATCC 33563]